MGNSAVAVLHYDMSGEIRDVSPRMEAAMRNFQGKTSPADFHFGQIISWDHASGYQVCVIHGNTGWRLLWDNQVPPDVEKAVAEVLKQRGWKCTPPSETRKK